MPLASQIRYKLELPQNYSVSGWLSLLKSFGPLAVTTGFPSGDEEWLIHGRIVSAINGDGTPDGTTLQIIDPDGGRVYEKTITDFAKEMEEMVKADHASDIRTLVLHF